VWIRHPAAAAVFGSNSVSKLLEPWPVVDFSLTVELE